MRRFAKILVPLSCCLAAGSTAMAQVPKIEAVVNAATFQSGLPTGGALASVFVSGFTDPKYYHPGLYVATSLPLPNQIGAIQVTVCNANAPLLAVSIPPLSSSDYAQINFQVPLERNVALLKGLAPGCSLTVGIPGYAGAAVSPLPDPPPFGGFFSGGHGYAVAQHSSDYSPVTPDNPARPSETIIAYANDLYVVWPEPPVGIPVPIQPSIDPIQNVSGYTYGAGQALLHLEPYPSCMPNPIDPVIIMCPTSTPPLKTSFLGLVPGQVGIEQVNFVVPANQQPGDWPLFIASSGGYSPYVLLPVR